MAKKTGQSGKFLTALGLMSGTSMDGIDLALIRTNGRRKVECGPSATWPYPASLRKRIEQALPAAVSWRPGKIMPDELHALERVITECHGEAVLGFLENNRLRLSDIDLVGFHGQTVLHRPDLGFTLQLGDGQALANRIGLPVVYDLRANDMAHGGQGAPLVPVYHRALARRVAGTQVKGDGSKVWPIAFVNIGGIANITWVGQDGTMIAFDTGPGNALIDQWVSAEAGIPFDQGGAVASEGRVVGEIVDRYLTHPYLQRSAPKSLDRNDFQPLTSGTASLEDGARSLARVTAETIWLARNHVPQPPALWIVCGGGSRNPIIMTELRDLAKGGAAIAAAEDFGLDSDSIEAEAWAYLAVRSLKGLNITWPSTTGVKQPTTGGCLVRPKQADLAAPDS